MSYKIAIASTDGKVVNQHFGRADRFYIVVVNKGEYAYEETRETGAACEEGNHSQDTLLQIISLLSDCSYVLASQIGPGAEYELNRKGILAFAISHYIESAVKKIIQYDSLKKNQ